MDNDNGFNHPDWVVGVGGHRTAAEGTCLMELASVIAGESFSASPSCVHPTLAALARLVNDHVGYHARQRLATLLPVMMTYEREDPAQDWAVIVGCLAFLRELRPTRRAARRLRRAQEQLQRAETSAAAPFKPVRSLRRRMRADWVVFKSCWAAHVRGEEAMVTLLTNAVAAYAGVRRHNVTASENCPPTREPITVAAMERTLSA